MTGKPFTRSYSNHYVLESEFFNDGKKMRLDDVVDLLNEQYEENKHLREILKIRNTNSKDLLDVLNEQEETIWSLKQKNQQLQKLNEFQAEAYKRITNVLENNGVLLTKKQLDEIIRELPFKQKVEETLQKRYNHLQKTQQETEKPPRYWQGAIMEIEVIADCLGVELK